jgi:hypothetical protein
MLKSFVTASCFVSLVACVQHSEAPPEIAKAMPQAESVSIKLPDQARSIGSRSVGQLANWYVATRDVTRMFNGGTGWVLVLLNTIVKFPVTSVSGDTYTWGPWSEALDPAEYKLDVRAVGDGTYEYQLSGRSKTAAAAEFQVVIDGKADPRKGDLQGNGQFLLDFDASRAVNPIDAGDARGSLDVNYDLAARHLDLTIMSTDAQGQPALASYAYNAGLDGGGDMTFALSGNAGGGPALETATLRSRWTHDGAGRADGRVAGGDLGTIQATASECWDTRFARVYYTDSVNLAGTEGNAAACAFATPDLPAN